MPKLLIGFFALFCLITSPLAATYPVDTVFTFKAMPTGVPMPGYLIPYTDPTFKTQVTRIADKTAFNSSSTIITHHYSKTQPWNSDGTLIMLAGWPAPILDGNTYQLLRTIMPPNDHHVWSNTQPYRIYGIQRPGTWEWVDARDGSVHVVRTFTRYTKVSLGEYEGNMSNDDRYAVFQAQTSTDNWIFVYDQTLDSVISRRNVGTSYPNNVAMSQSGAYVVIEWNAEGNSDKQGIGVYDRNLAYLRNVGTCGGCHFDLGYNTQGQEVAVFSDQLNDTRALVMTRLDNGTQTTLLTDAQMSWYIHVSCRNINRPGWAYVTEFADVNSQTTKPYYQVAFAVKLDGSGTVERFAHVHHSTTHEYEREGHGVPSRDGSRFVFKSDWDNFANPVYSYIAEMPSPTALLNSIAPSVLPAPFSSTDVFFDITGRQVTPNAVGVRIIKTIDRSNRTRISIEK